MLSPRTCIYQAAVLLPSYADSCQIFMWLMRLHIFFTKLDIGILSIFLEVCCNHLDIFEGIINNPNLKIVIVD